MRDSCERSDPNGMGRPSFSAQTRVRCNSVMLHYGKHSFPFSQKPFYNRIMVHRRACRNMKNCLLLVNYRLPVSSNSPPRSDLATGLFALIIRKALWSPRASANASPRMEGSRRNNYAPPQKIFYRQLLVDSRFLTISWQQGRCVTLDVHGRGT